MLNKQTLALKSKSTGAEIFYPMEQRCNFLRELLKTEPAAEVRLYLRSIDLGQMRENHRKPSKVHDSSLLCPKGFCHVLDYEQQHPELLEESPNYWAKKLPEGAMFGHSALKSKS